MPTVPNDAADVEACVEIGVDGCRAIGEFDVIGKKRSPTEY